MARLSFALPILDRCERPRTASVRFWRLQPWRLAHGPDEKCGIVGRTPGLVAVIYLSFQIGAPRWGGVSHPRHREIREKPQVLQCRPCSFLQLLTGTCSEQPKEVAHG